MVSSSDPTCRKATPRDTRRQAILDLARDIFMQDGYAAASMSAIAARLGGSKGTLYNYFNSKEELFATVIAEECACRQKPLFDSLDASGEDVVSTLREVGRRYAKLVLTEHAIAFSRIVIAETGRFPELGGVFYDSGPRNGRARIAAYVRRQMEAGRLRKADPYKLAEQFCDLCLGSLYRQRLLNVVGEPDADTVAANVEAALDLILAAYRPASP